MAGFARLRPGEEVPSRTHLHTDQSIRGGQGLKTQVGCGANPCRVISHRWTVLNLLPRQKGEKDRGGGGLLSQSKLGELGNGICFIQKLWLLPEIMAQLDANSWRPQGRHCARTRGAQCAGPDHGRHGCHGRYGQTP